MNKSRGLTMVELLVVIAIVAILARLAAPSFKQTIQSVAMASAVNTFMADMRYARSESIRRNGGVVMCRSINAETNATCAVSGDAGDWETGWIVFHNLNNGSNRSTNEPLLRVQGPITSVNTIAESGSSDTIFRFTATGRLSLSSSTSIQFGSNPKFASDARRIVCVNLGGRARIALDSAGKANGDASCATDQ